MTLPASNISIENTRSIFTHNRKIIPFFQREYSWDKKQIDELFEDILLAYKTGEENCILGNIVLLTFDRRDCYVIDGQQRLTTIYLILELLYELVVKYDGLKSLLDGLINNYKLGDRNKFISKNIMRENDKGELIDLDIPTEKREYIKNKILTLISENVEWEEPTNILDYLIDNVSFVKQTFFATERNTEEEKTKVFVSILDYFVKLNTRGKSFSLEETEELINKLNRR